MVYVACSCTLLYVFSSAIDGFYPAIDDCCGCCCILDTDGFMFYYSATGSYKLP